MRSARLRDHRSLGAIHLGRGGRGRQCAPESRGDTRGSEASTTKLPNVTGMATPEAAALMGIGVDEEALTHQAFSIHQINEVGEGDTWV